MGDTLKFEIGRYENGPAIPPAFTSFITFSHAIIDTSYTSVQYSSFDRAVVMIKKLGFKAVFKNGRKICI
jgi:hypothetical protein